MNTIVQEEGISTKQFALLTGVARQTIQNYVENGILPYIAVKKYPNGRAPRYTLPKSLADAIAETNDWDTAIAAYKQRQEQESE